MFETNVDWTRWILSLLALTALMGGFAIILKKIQLTREGGKTGALKLFGANNTMRLKVIETRLIDARNKVCIFEKDDKEFTVIFTPQNATLIETKPINIQKKSNDNSDA